MTAELKTMTRDEKIVWMTEWARKNGATLSLNGECGFGRPCVGVVANSLYPDYDEDNDIWIPKGAYHKHPCVAVLEHGEKSEDQLYQWLKWFEDNGYTIECGVKEDGDFSPIELLLNSHLYAKMVKI